MRRKKSLSLISLLLVALLAVVPVTCCAVFFALRVSAQLESNARSSVDFYIAQFTDRTESVLDALRNSVYLLTTDTQVRAAMRSPTVKGNPSATEAEESAARTIRSTMGWEQSAITGVFLIKSEADFLSVLREGIYSGGTNRVMGVYRDYRDHNSARSLLVSPDVPDYCYLVVDYLDINTMEALGKIIIELDIGELVNDQYMKDMYGNASVYLSDPDHRVLYGDPDSPLPAAIRGEGAEAGFIRVDGREYYHTGRNLGIYNLQVDVFVPGEEIFAAIQETVRLYIWFTLGVLALTLVAGIGVYLLMTRPLRGMVGAIDAVSEGDLTVRMPETPYRETERLVDAFNDMTEHLGELFQEVYTKGLYLKEAEFATLESQINPHFIFNVLEVINVRAMAADQPEICRMVSNLAQLLRGSVSQKHRQKTTFGQELDYVRYYLELQKERFQEDLRYDIQIEDPGILDYYLPKLTIQPVVENSVVHGLENKRGGGTVEVRIWEEESGVCVRVADDGIGFESHRLGLDRPAGEAAENHNHVALYNINRRIQLLYGQEYGLTVDSRPGRGAEVLLSLPVDLEREQRGGETECLKVMLVDNEAVIRKGLARFIDWESLDCRISAQAADGEEALERIALEEPDLVITDIRMPGMDGMGLARELSQRYPHIKVILLTGYPDFSYAQKAITYGVVDFVLKPTTAESLTQAVVKAKKLVFEERSRQELSRQLESRSEENLQLQQEIFLSSLIRQPGLSQLFVMNRLAELGLHLGGYHLLRITAAPLNGEDWEPERSLEQVKGILKDLLQENRAFFVPQGDQTCYGIVCTEDTARLTGLCREAVGLAEALSRFAASIGISRRWDDPMGMGRAAEQAAQAQQYAAYFPENRVMCHGDMPAVDREALTGLAERLRLLCQAVEQQNGGGAEEALEHLFRLIYQEKVPMDEVRSFCTYFYNFCVSHLYGGNAEKYLSDHTLPALDALLATEQLRQLQANLAEFIRQILSRFAPDSQETEDLIRRVTEHVRHNYAGDLSLETLSKMVYLSPSYLSKLFKRETGENLSAYIQGVRIQQAKLLLSTTALKSYQVGERVGIGDPVYFSRIFKKLVGVKPKDYRRESQKEGAIS